MSQPINPGTLVSSLKTSTEPLFEISEITAVAEGSTKAQADIACDDSLEQGDHVVINYWAGANSSGLAKSLAVWLSVDGDHTTPTGTAIDAADEKIRVDVVTGVDNAGTVAAAFVAAINGSTASTRLHATVSGDAGLLVNYLDYGVPPSPGIATYDNSEAFSPVITAGMDLPGTGSSIQNFAASFSDQAANHHYVWMNVYSQGVDPALTGTGHAVALSGGQTADQVATAIAAVIDALAAFTSQADHQYVQVSDAATGNATDISSANFTVRVKQQGTSGSYYPAMFHSTISNNPAP